MITRIAQFFLISVLLVSSAAKVDKDRLIEYVASTLTSTSCKAASQYWVGHVLNASLSLPCIIARLKKDNKDGVAWAALGMHFESADMRDHAKSSFSYARAGLGKRSCSRTVKHWWYLGPFTIGKHEIDGDPVFDAPYSDGPLDVPLDAILYSEVCRQIEEEKEESEKDVRIWNIRLTESIFFLQLVGHVSWFMVPSSGDAVVVAPQASGTFVIL